MLARTKEKFDQKDLLKLFPNGKTKNVSFFHKFNKLEDLKDKVITVVDFEFSIDYQIFEMAFFDILNDKIINIEFKEFQLPLKTKFFDAKRGHMRSANEKFNQGKEKLTSSWKKYIMDRMEKCDYLLSHNYIAELQCYNALKNPKTKYDSDVLDIFTKGQVICTRYSFGKKYFSNHLDVKEFSNGSLSNNFNWKVVMEYKKNLRFIVRNQEIDYLEIINIDSSIKIDENISYHNALYDIVVTYTNFLSLKHLMHS